MISILRGRIARVVALPVAVALALALGLGTQTAEASNSQVCGNSGSGYCLNDWGGAGASGDAIKMYYGGTRNDDFYVIEVNRCEGSYTVTSTYYGDSSNCPFGTTGLDNEFWGDPIVEIVDTNAETECVASNSSDYAVLGSCANPINGSGGADGVIMVSIEACYSPYGYGFVDRYTSDPHSKPYYLTSGGNPGVQAYYGSSSVSCWNGFQYFSP
jgi:hypothetical protein